MLIQIVTPIPVLILIIIIIPILILHRQTQYRGINLRLSHRLLLILIILRYNRLSPYPLGRIWENRVILTGMIMNSTMISKEENSTGLKNL